MRVEVFIVCISFALTFGMVRGMVFPLSSGNWKFHSFVSDFALSNEFPACSKPSTAKMFAFVVCPLNQVIYHT